MSPFVICHFLSARTHRRESLSTEDDTAPLNFGDDNSGPSLSSYTSSRDVSRSDRALVRLLPMLTEHASDLTFDFLGLAGYTEFCRQFTKDVRARMCGREPHSQSDVLPYVDLRAAFEGNEEEKNGSRVSLVSMLSFINRLIKRGDTTIVSADVACGLSAALARAYISIVQHSRGASRLRLSRRTISNAPDLSRESDLGIHPSSVSPFDSHVASPIRGGRSVRKALSFHSDADDSANLFTFTTSPSSNNVADHTNDNAGGHPRRGSALFSIGSEPVMEMHQEEADDSFDMRSEPFDASFQRDGDSADSGDDEFTIQTKKAHHRGSRRAVDTQKAPHSEHEEKRRQEELTSTPYTSVSKDTSPTHDLEEILVEVLRSLFSKAEIVAELVDTQTLPLFTKALMGMCPFPEQYSALEGLLCVVLDSPVASSKGSIPLINYLKNLATIVKLVEALRLLPPLPSQKKKGGGGPDGFISTSNKVKEDNTASSHQNESLSIQEREEVLCNLQRVSSTLVVMSKLLTQAVNCSTSTLIDFNEIGGNKVVLGAVQWYVNGLEIAIKNETDRTALLQPVMKSISSMVYCGPEELTAATVDDILLPFELPPPSEEDLAKRQATVRELFNKSSYAKVRSLEGFLTLQSLFMSCEHDYVRRATLEIMHSVLDAHPDNYPIVRGLNTFHFILSDFHNLSRGIQRYVLDMVTSVLKTPATEWVPFHELATLRTLFQEELMDIPCEDDDGTCMLADAFSAICRLCSNDLRFQKVLQEADYVSVALKRLRRMRHAITKWQESSPGSPSNQRPPSVPTQNKDRTRDKKASAPKRGGSTEFSHSNRPLDVVSDTNEEVDGKDVESVMSTTASVGRPRVFERQVSGVVSVADESFVNDSDDILENMIQSLRRESLPGIEENIDSNVVRKTNAASAASNSNNNTATGASNTKGGDTRGSGKSSPSTSRRSSVGSLSSLVGSDRGDEFEFSRAVTVLNDLHLLLSGNEASQTAFAADNGHPVLLFFVMHYQTRDIALQLIENIVRVSALSADRKDAARKSEKKAGDSGGSTSNVTANVSTSHMAGLMGIGIGGGSGNDQVIAGFIRRMVEMLNSSHTSRSTTPTFHEDSTTFAYVQRKFSHDPIATATFKVRVLQSLRRMFSTRRVQTCFASTGGFLSLMALLVGIEGETSLHRLGRSSRRGSTSVSPGSPSGEESEEKVDDLLDLIPPELKAIPNMDPSSIIAFLQRQSRQTALVVVQEIFLLLSAAFHNNSEARKLWEEQIGYSRFFNALQVSGIFSVDNGSEFVSTWLLWLALEYVPKPPAPASLASSLRNAGRFGSATKPPPQQSKWGPPAPRSTSKNLRPGHRKRGTFLSISDAEGLSLQELQNIVAIQASPAPPSGRKTPTGHDAQSSRMSDLAHHHTLVSPVSEGRVGSPGVFYSPGSSLLFSPKNPQIFMDVSPEELPLPSKSALQNPTAVLLMFEVLPNCRESFQQRHLEYISSVFMIDASIAATLGSRGLLMHIFTAYRCQLLNKESTLQPLLLQMVRGLIGYTSSVSELHHVFEVIQSSSPDEWAILVDTLLQADREATWPFIKFDMTRHPFYGSLTVPSLKGRAWPPSHGYSVSMWILVTSFGSEHAPLRLYRFASADSKSVTDAFIYNGRLCIQTGGKKPVPMDQFTFKTGQWYHLVVCHSRGRIQSSSVRVFVNGVKVDSGKVPYPVSSNENVQLIFGTEERFMERTSIKWRLVSAAVIEECLSNDAIVNLYSTGPRMAGLVGIGSQKPSIFDVTEKYASMLPQDVDMRLDEGGHMEIVAHDSGDMNGTAPLLPAVLPFEKVMCFLHVSNFGVVHSSLSDARRKVVAKTSTIRCHSLTRMELELPEDDRSPLDGEMTVVICSSGYADIMSARLLGACDVFLPLKLADALRRVGGVKRLFTLIESCENSTVLAKVLLLLHAMLKESPKNCLEMEQLNGYQLVSGILNERMVDQGVVDILFALMGLTEKCIAGTISNCRAFEAFVTNSRLWTQLDLPLQSYLFQGLVTTITNNEQRVENMQILRELRLVPWVLSLHANADFPPELLIYTISLLRTMLMDELVRDELELVASATLNQVVLPSTSSSGGAVPADSSSFSLTDFHHFPSANASGSSAPKTPRKAGGRRLSKPNLLRDLAVRHGVVEMIFDVLTKLEDRMSSSDSSVKNRAQKAFDLFSSVFDFQWAFCLLLGSESSSGRERFRDQVTAVLALKILLSQFQLNPSLLKQFRNNNGFEKLSFLLLPYCGCMDVYSVVSCMMLNRSVRDVPAYDPSHMSSSKSLLRSLRGSTSEPDVIALVTEDLGEASVVYEELCASEASFSGTAELPAEKSSSSPSSASPSPSSAASMAASRIEEYLYVWRSLYEGGRVDKSGSDQVVPEALALLLDLVGHSIDHLLEHDENSIYGSSSSTTASTHPHATAAPSRDGDDSDVYASARGAGGGRSLRTSISNQHLSNPRGGSPTKRSQSPMSALMEDRRSNQESKSKTPRDHKSKKRGHHHQRTPKSHRPSLCHGFTGLPHPSFHLQNAVVVLLHRLFDSNAAFRGICLQNNKGQFLQAVSNPLFKSSTLQSMSTLSNIEESKDVQDIDDYDDEDEGNDEENEMDEEEEELSSMLRSHDEFDSDFDEEKEEEQHGGSSAHIPDLRRASTDLHGLKGFKELITPPKKQSMHRHFLHSHNPSTVTQTPSLGRGRHLKQDSVASAASHNRRGSTDGAYRDFTPVASYFTSETSALLLHLFHKAAVLTYISRSKGPQFLEEMLNVNPILVRDAEGHTFESQCRIPLPNERVAYIIRVLQPIATLFKRTVTPKILQANSKFANNFVKLCELLRVKVERSHLRGFEMEVAEMILPHLNPEEMLTKSSGLFNTLRRNKHPAFSILRPLLATANSIVLTIVTQTDFGNDEGKTMRVLTWLDEHKEEVFGMNNFDTHFYTCMSHFLVHRLLESERDNIASQLSSSIFGYLLRIHLQTMVEILTYTSPTGELHDLASKGFDNLVGGDLDEFFSWFVPMRETIKWVFDKSVSNVWREYTIRMRRERMDGLCTENNLIKTETKKHEASVKESLGEFRRFRFTLMNKRHKARDSDKFRLLRLQQNMEDRFQLAKESWELLQAEMFHTEALFEKVTDDGSTLYSCSPLDGDPTTMSKTVASAPSFLMTSDMELRQRWRLDFTEGPMRMRKKLVREVFWPKGDPLFPPVQSWDEEVPTMIKVEDITSGSTVTHPGTETRFSLESITSTGAERIAVEQIPEEESGEHTSTEFSAYSQSAEMSRSSRSFGDEDRKSKGDNDDDSNDGDDEPEVWEDGQDDIEDRKGDGKELRTGPTVEVKGEGDGDDYHEGETIHKSPTSRPPLLVSAAGSPRASSSALDSNENIHNTLHSPQPVRRSAASGSSSSSFIAPDSPLPVPNSLVSRSPQSPQQALALSLSPQSSPNQSSAFRNLVRHGSERGTMSTSGKSSGGGMSSRASSSTQRDSMTKGSPLLRQSSFHTPLGPNSPMFGSPSMSPSSRRRVVAKEILFSPDKPRSRRRKSLDPLEVKYDEAAKEQGMRLDFGGDAEVEKGKNEQSTDNNASKTVGGSSLVTETKAPTIKPDSNSNAPLAIGVVSVGEEKEKSGNRSTEKGSSNSSLPSLEVTPQLRSTVSSSSEQLNIPGAGASDLEIPLFRPLSDPLPPASSTTSVPTHRRSESNSSDQPMATTPTHVARPRGGGRHARRRSSLSAVESEIMAAAAASLNSASGSLANDVISEESSTVTTTLSMESMGSRTSTTGDASVGEVEEDEEKWMLEEERLRLQLEADDEILFHYNCLRVEGLEDVNGVFLLCSHNMYTVDNYAISPEGNILKLDSESETMENPYAVLPGHRPDIATMRTTSPSKQIAADDGGFDGDVLGSPKRFHPLYYEQPTGVEGRHVLHQCRRWSYLDVKECHTRRHLLRETALELFFNDGTNFLLVVNIKQRDVIYNHIMHFCPNIEKRRNPLVKITRSLDPAKSMRMWVRDMQAKWVNGQMTNFEYLMHLNSAAGRTYNDLTQYPVFPWILSDYTSRVLDLDDFSVYRDLSKPMGALSHKRATEFLQRYIDSEIPSVLDPTQMTPRFHFGTHYSSAATVLYYLVRMEPFTNHTIELQSGRFDRPDRIFRSIVNTWLSASESSTSDVKELIPEFFCCPEFLLNGNELDMGTLQSGSRIDHVALPPWAKKSCREFIRLNRRALESEFVSANMHLWIDLIFGFRQQGKAAEEALNVFHYLTYEGNVNIDDIEDELHRAATIDQIRNFGQTPIQLFRDPHPARKRMPDTPVMCVPTLSGRMQILGVQGYKFPIGSIVNMDGSGENVTVTPRHSEVLPHKPNQCITWGHLDGTVRICTMDSHRIKRIYRNLHESAVRIAALTRSGNKLVTGGDDTTLCVWRLLSKKGVSQHKAMESKGPEVRARVSETSGKLMYVGNLLGHREAPTCIDVSEDFSLIVSGSRDHTIILWDLNRLTCLRQLRAFTDDVVSVSINRLNGDIVACSKNEIRVWDINGKLLASWNAPSLWAGDLSCVRIASLNSWEMQSSAGIIVSGHQSGIVRVWDIIHDSLMSTSNTPVSALSNNNNTDVRCAQTANDGDSPVIKESWALRERCTLDGHKSPITALSLTSNLEGIWSGDSSGVTLRWGVPEVDKYTMNPLDHSVSMTANEQPTLRSLEEEDALQRRKDAPLHPPIANAACVGGCKSKSKTNRLYWCSQCPEIVCSECRLPHLRSAHNIERKFQAWQYTAHAPIDIVRYYSSDILKDEKPPTVPSTAAAAGTEDSVDPVCENNMNESKGEEVDDNTESA